MHSGVSCAVGLIEKGSPAIKIDELLAGLDITVVANVLSVTGETVRKDLVRFERQGLLRRVHGGAVPVTHLSNEPAVDAPDGISSPEAAIKRRMPSCAHRCILLADHSKVGAVSGVRCGEVSDVDLLITDVGLDEPRLVELSTAGPRVDAYDPCGSVWGVADRFRSPRGHRRLTGRLVITGCRPARARDARIDRCRLGSRRWAA